MVCYVVLFKLTDRGVQGEGQVARSWRQLRDEAERRGIAVLNFLWTQGEYDFVAVMEAPDDSAISSFILGAASTGYVRTHTLRAFSEAELAAAAV